MKKTWLSLIYLIVAPWIPCELHALAQDASMAATTPRLLVGDDVMHAVRTSLGDVQLRISSFDSDQGDVDAREFVEITNDGSEPVDLAPYTLVFFDGHTSLSYFALQLEGTIRSNATHLSGNPDVDGINQAFPANTLQDGPDAIAILRRSPATVPEGTPVEAILDDVVAALVYVHDDSIFTHQTVFLGSENCRGPGCTEGVHGIRFEPIFPNPFHSRTSIRFGLMEPAYVRLFVYDVLGREVERLISANLSAGRHDVMWDGRDNAGHQAASGLYICKLVAGGISISRQIIFTP